MPSQNAFADFLANLLKTPGRRPFLPHSLTPETLASLLYDLCTTYASPDAAQVRAAETALEQFPVSDLAKLRELCLDRTRYSLRDNADFGGPGQWATTLLTAIPFLAPLLSMHASGYVRQVAVEHLSKRFDGVELPYLFMRINDYVKPVRLAAVAAVEMRLAHQYLDKIARILPLMLRAENWQRAAVPLRRRIADFLASPEVRDLLTRQLDSPDSLVSRAAFEILMREELDESLLDRLSGKRDAGLLIRLAVAAASNPSPAAARILERLLTGRFIAVRRIALRALADRKAAFDLTPYLFDPFFSLRDIAQFYLKRPAAEYAALYRQALADPARRQAAVAGLGETGTTPDAALLVPFAAAPHRVRTRAAAVKSIAALDMNNYIPLLTAALADTSASVSHAAFAALKFIASSLDLAALESLVAAAPDHAIPRITRLLAEASKWDALASLLRIAGSPRDVASKSACERLEFWMDHYNKTFTKPTRAQLYAARVALPRAKIPPALAETIESNITAWKRRVSD